MKKAKEIDILEIGKDVLENEARAVVVAREKLGASFVSAVLLLSGTKGKVLLSGIGKSGIVARKIAATLSSTGTFSIFLHPTEALHGDLGTVARDDVAIIVSDSGETGELVALAAILKKFKNTIIAITAHEGSTIGKIADIVISTHVKEEACQSCTAFNLAPTTSTLVQLAIGDAIASALQEIKGFKIEHFAAIHPGGNLGNLLQA
jgi:arabinose-5-phosphate isomerase